MRAGVIVVQRKIKRQMQQPRACEGDEGRAFGPKRKAQEPAPDEEGVIDREDRLPCVGIIEDAEDDLCVGSHQEQVPAGHKIERQIGGKRAEQCGGCDAGLAFLREGGGAENQMSRGVHVVFTLVPLLVTPKP